MPRNFGESTVVERPSDAWADAPHQLPPVRLRILADPGIDAREHNPYTTLLYGNMQADVENFSYRRCLTGRYDILHIHWPHWELAYWKNSSSVLIRLLRKLAAIDFARARGAKLVWTAHNLKAHDGLHPRLEQWFSRQFLGRLDGFLSLTEGGRSAVWQKFPQLRDCPSFVIPHGHYRNQYQKEDRPAARRALGITETERVILFFGQIRPYKNVPGLVSAFRQARIPGAVLQIAGRPNAPELKAEVETAAQGDSSVRLDLTQIPDSLVQRYFSAADLVILPFSDIFNSGSAILALSLNRPVLVPRWGAMSELEAAIGPDWVRTYSGDLTGSEISAALAWATGRVRPAAAPLSHLDWPEISRKTEAAYRRLRHPAG